MNDTFRPNASIGYPGYHEQFGYSLEEWNALTGIQQQEVERLGHRLDEDVPTNAPEPESVDEDEPSGFGDALVAAFDAIQAPDEKD